MNEVPFYFDQKISFDASSGFNLHLLVSQQRLVKLLTVITLKMFPFLHLKLLHEKKKIYILQAYYLRVSQSDKKF